METPTGGGLMIDHKVVSTSPEERLHRLSGRNWRAWVKVYRLSYLEMGMVTAISNAIYVYVYIYSFVLPMNTFHVFSK